MFLAVSHYMTTGDPTRKACCVICRCSHMWSLPDESCNCGYCHGRPLLMLTCYATVTLALTFGSRVFNNIIRISPCRKIAAYFCWLYTRQWYLNLLFRFTIGKYCMLKIFSFRIVKCSWKSVECINNAGNTVNGLSIWIAVMQLSTIDDESNAVDKTILIQRRGSHKMQTNVAISVISNDIHLPLYILET